MPDTNSNRFDRDLRGKAGGYRKEPNNRVWEKLQTNLATPAPRKNYRAAGFVLLGLLLVLLGNLLPEIGNLALPQNHKPKAEAQTETPVSARFSEATQASVSKAQQGLGKPSAAKPAQITQPDEARLATPRQPLPAVKFQKRNKQKKTESSATTTRTEPATTQPATTPTKAKETEDLAVFAEVKSGESPASGNTFPAVLQPLAATEREVQELTLAASPEAAGNELLVQALQAQKQELENLQLRADSLLALYLREPAENPAFPSVADTAQNSKPKNRWSAALAVAPELNFMHLSAPATDTLMEMRRNHESGRAGASASLSLEYQLSNRLRLGAGIGYSTYGAELRLTNTQTLLNVRYDTTTQLTTQHYTNTHTNYIVQQDSTAVMDPIFNQSGQVIGYNTVYVTHPDTTWHTVIVEGTDTVRTQTITPLIHQTQKTTYRKLKPQYHFVTLPVMLYYKLTPGKRWWAEAGVGGQLQLFRGGTQLVTEDGRTYHTEKVGPNEGPFRPVNLALMGNLSVNYGLSERLSVSVAPAVRWQVQSVYKKETGLKQKPLATGLQFGLRYVLH